jgi:hypothetical protein
MFNNHLIAFNVCPVKPLTRKDIPVPINLLGSYLGLPDIASLSFLPETLLTLQIVTAGKGMFFSG